MLAVLDFATQVYTLLLVAFILVMSIVLWNAGLMASLRRYGEFGIRLALGEDHGRLYRSLIVEGVVIGSGLPTVTVPRPMRS